MTDKFSTYRNIATHSPVVFSPYLILRPDIDVASTRDRLRRAFREIRHDEFWDVLAGDLNALAVYAGAIAYEIYYPGFVLPLPGRPRLLSLEQILQIESQTNRLAQKQARLNQQFASQRKRELERRRKTLPSAEKYSDRPRPASDI